MDVSGAVVPNANVTAVDTATGRRFSVKTSERGSYTVPALPPSRYTVTAEAAGFDSVLQSNVEVAALATVTVDVRLKVGAAHDVVTVSSLPPQLDTVNGTLEVAIPAEIYESLPVAMNGGPMSPLGFVSLTPGVSGGGNNTFVLNGGAAQASATYVNGMPVSNPGLGGDQRVINQDTALDAVKEFQVLTSGIPAYYSGAGVINLVMKSGTQKFHGDAYWVVRNTVFDAAGYFSTQTPIERQNEYGATLGGPVWKNRVFFLFNFDGYHYVHAGTPLAYDVPSLAERQGDFSAIPTPLYDPNTVNCTGGKCTATRFPGNIIPPSRLSPVSLFLQSFLPAPTSAGTIGNFYSSIASDHTQNTYYGKLDFTLSSKNNLSFLSQNGYLNDAKFSPNGGPQLPLPYTSSRYGPGNSRLYEIQDTHTITPNLLNVFGYEMNRFVSLFISPTNSGVYGAGKAGLTGIPPGDAQNEFPPISFAGQGPVTPWALHPYASNNSLYLTSQVFQDNVQWVHNNHNITVGGELRFSAQNANAGIRTELNNITFSSHETAGFVLSGPAAGTLAINQGNAYASFLLGAVDNASLTDGLNTNEFGTRFRRYALYAQDDWKVARRLTVNLGYRYELPIPAYDVHNALSFLNINQPNPAVGNHPGALEFAGSGPDSCNCRTSVKTHYLAMEPRVGFAWVPANNIVLRGSYGIMHYLGSGEFITSGQLGYVARPSFATPDNGLHQAFNWNNGFPAYNRSPTFDPTVNSGFNTATGPFGGVVTYTNPDRGGRTPYTEYWNLTLQQQLTHTTTMSISYVGSASHLLPLANGYGPYSNFLDPRYLVLGSLLQQQYSPAILQKAQAIVPGIQIPYPNFVGSIAQMLRPFPQYQGINDIGANAGDGHYHAMQILLQNQLNHGLFVHAAYTWNREIDDSGGNAAYQADATASRTPYNLQLQRTVSPAPEQVFTTAAVYTLPFGRGHRFGSDRLTDAFLGGWRLSVIASYVEGGFLGPFTTTTCNLPNAGGCYADYNPNFAGSVRINGPWGKGSQYGLPKSPTTSVHFLDVKAFQSPAPFTYGTTPVNGAYALRGPVSKNEQVALDKTFRTWRESTFMLKASAFNVFNRTEFGGISTNVNLPNFGEVTSQANQPRILQFQAKISF